MNIGSNFVTQVQYPAKITGTESGPFNLTQVWGSPSLEILTTPNKDTLQTSTILFDTSLFSDPTSVTIDEVVEVINKTQALYYTVGKDSNGYITLAAGGMASSSHLNSITLVSGNQYLLDMFGLTEGQNDTYTNVDNPLKNRYGLAADMVINIEVITDSINTRVELSDLVYTFFGYYLQKKCFQFYGRSFFDQDIENEWFHLVLKNQFNWSGETNKPRQGGEQYEHVYSIRGSVAIYIEDFIDKIVMEEPVWLDDSNIVSDRAAIGVDITGDYFGTNYRK